MRKAEAEGVAREKDEQRAEAKRKAEAKAMAEAAEAKRKAEYVAERKAEAARKAEAERNSQAKREEDERWAKELAKEEAERKAKLQAGAAAEEARKDAELAAAEEAKRVAQEVQAAHESERAARRQAKRAKYAKQAAAAAKKRAERQEAQRKIEAEEAVQAAAQAAAKAQARANEATAAKEPKAAKDITKKEFAKPKPAREVTDARAVGDPHVVNMYGQRFDIQREGNHTLIHIPRNAEPTATLLNVNGEVYHMGGACADMYFHSISVQGKWAADLSLSLSKGKTRSAGFNFFADAAHESNSTHWTRFGSKLDLKIVWGMTITGVRYLNILVKHLADVQFSVGGLLGGDDHSTIATPVVDCKRTVSLLSIGSHPGAGVSKSDGSFDELAQVTHDSDYH
ncbi:unnamed protein product [Prorocentrum cordatum]|uniref:Altered inheritance of mitochondria protein 24, mitochondrial n=2 Tax=Prorocentrum cordatum TaxID=2364126 RepID=A0ABN9UDN8_9DINO|nr:unnamed protein product [Polarella glacialis]